MQQIQHQVLLIYLTTYVDGKNMSNVIQQKKYNSITNIRTNIIRTYNNQTQRHFETFHET